MDASGNQITGMLTGQIQYNSNNQPVLDARAIPSIATATRSSISRRVNP